MRLLPDAQPQTACVVTLGGIIQEQNEETKEAKNCVGQSIQNYIPELTWESIATLTQQHGTVTLSYVAQLIGRDRTYDIRAEWTQQDDRLYGVLLSAKLLSEDPYQPAPAKIVMKVTDDCEEKPERKLQMMQNGNSYFSIPVRSLPPMTLHQSLHLAARNAFQKLPLLAHKEILETSTFEATDKIRICCESKEDAIALHEGRWDLASCAILLYPQEDFELYHLGKDQQPTFYKSFSTREAALAGELQRREVQTMINQIDNGNGHRRELLMPSDPVYTEAYNTVLFSPDVMTLVTEAESKPIIVSRQYAALTQKSVTYWVGAGSINKAGWAPGELERMQGYLVRDGHLHNFEYKAYLHDFDEVTTWYTSFQRIFCDGEWMRVAKVLDIVKANLVAI